VCWEEELGTGLFVSQWCHFPAKHFRTRAPKLKREVVQRKWFRRGGSEGY